MVLPASPAGATGLLPETPRALEDGMVLGVRPLPRNGARPPLQGKELDSPRGELLSAALARRGGLEAELLRLANAGRTALAREFVVTADPEKFENELPILRDEFRSLRFKSTDELLAWVALLTERGAEGPLLDRWRDVLGGKHMKGTAQIARRFNGEFRWFRFKAGARSQALEKFTAEVERRGGQVLLTREAGKGRKAEVTYVVYAESGRMVDSLFSKFSGQGLESVAKLDPDHAESRKLQDEHLREIAIEAFDHPGLFRDLKRLLEGHDVKVLEEAVSPAGRKRRVSFRIFVPASGLSDELMKAIGRMHDYSKSRELEEGAQRFRVKAVVSGSKEATEGAFLGALSDAGVNIIVPQAATVVDERGRETVQTLYDFEVEAPWAVNGEMIESALARAFLRGELLESSVALNGAVPGRSTESLRRAKQRPVSFAHGKKAKGRRGSSLRRPSLDGVADLVTFLGEGWGFGAWTRTAVLALADVLARNSPEADGGFFSRLKDRLKGIEPGTADGLKAFIVALGTVPDYSFTMEAVRAVLAAARRSLLASTGTAHSAAVLEAVSRGGLEGRISADRVHVLTGQGGGLTTFTRERDGSTDYIVSESDLKAWEAEEGRRPGYKANALAMTLWHELAESVAGPDFHARLLELGLDRTGVSALYDAGLSADQVSAELRERGARALAEAERRAGAEKALAEAAPVVETPLTDRLQATLDLARRLIPGEPGATDALIQKRLKVGTKFLELRLSAEAVERSDDPFRAGYAWGVAAGASGASIDRQRMLSYVDALSRFSTDAVRRIREALAGYLTVFSILRQGEVSRSLIDGSRADRMLVPVVHVTAETTQEQVDWMFDRLNALPVTRVKGIVVLGPEKNVRDLVARIRGKFKRHDIFLAEERDARREDGLFYLENVLDDLSVWEDIKGKRAAVPVMSPVAGQITSEDADLRSMMVLFQVVATQLVRVSVDMMDEIRGAVKALVSA